MDKSGTSDPYVKFKSGSRLLYKSKTVRKELNPVFDEMFTVPIEDPFELINIKVFCSKIFFIILCDITISFRFSITTLVFKMISWVLRNLISRSWNLIDLKKSL